MSKWRYFSQCRVCGSGHLPTEGSRAIGLCFDCAQKDFQGLIRIPSPGYHFRPTIEAEADVEEEAPYLD